MLINRKRVTDYLTKEAPYADGHGAKGDYLGAGLLYYTIPYILKSGLCVCLGSGGGFVHRMMKQAQRDLGNGGRVILVDANIEGVWGSPQWLDEKSFFKTQFPDIEIWMMRTDDAYLKLQEERLRPDYIHIDADHSYECARKDFDNYSRLLSSKGFISMHDTNCPTDLAGVQRVIGEIRKDSAWEVLDMKDIGVGTALIRNTDRVQRRRQLFDEGRKKIDDMLAGRITDKGYRNCPFCREFLKLRSGDECRGCPVSEHKKVKFCGEGPSKEWQKHQVTVHHVENNVPQGDYGDWRRFNNYVVRCPECVRLLKEHMRFVDELEESECGGLVQGR